MLSGWSIGRKIRSPIELAVGWMRTMNCTTNVGFLSERLRTIGQAVLFPPNVKGWEGGRAGINSSTLVGRANLIYELIHHEKTRFGGVPLSAFVDRNHANNPDQLATRFAKLFFVEELSDTERKRLSKSLDSSKPQHWSVQSLVYLASLPRIHLS